jgi:hypothetical protein
MRRRVDALQAVYRRSVPLFPPAVPVTILVDGRPLAAYRHAYFTAGRVFAPVTPLLARVADRIWLDGGTLVVERAGRRVRVRLAPAPTRAAAVVAIGPVLRSLAIPVQYDGRARRLLILVPARTPVASPTPFDASRPTAPPSVVFTPSPSPAPRPLWSGSPLPRRTPLPIPPH